MKLFRGQNNDDTLTKVRVRIKRLELPPILTIDDLTERVSEHWNLNIKIEKAELPITVGGCSFQAEDGFIIFYNQIRTGYAKDFVISHELGHILRGDAKYLSKTLNRSEVVTAFKEGQILEGILCNLVVRAVQNPMAEREANLYASLFMERLASQEEAIFDKNNSAWLFGIEKELK
jgi:IrrE N-terminal-like domain